MNKSRVEAFSEGVIAIIITIMELELHIPDLKEKSTAQNAWHALFSLLPKSFTSPPTLHPSQDPVIYFTLLTSPFAPLALVTKETEYHRLHRSNCRRVA